MGSTRAPRASGSALADRIGRRAKKVSTRASKLTCEGACAPLTDVRDHATSEIAIGSRLGIDATKKPVGKGFKCACPPLFRMNEAMQMKLERIVRARLG